MQNTVKKHGIVFNWIYRFFEKKRSRTIMKNDSNDDKTSTEKARQENAENKNTNAENGGGQELKKQAGSAVEQVKEKAAGVLDEQKGKVTSGLSDVADSIRKVGENLGGAENENAIAQTTARYSDLMARKIEGLSGYLENADIRDLGRDVQKFARQQPTLFVGGAFLLGILAARFLKTSSPDGNSTQR